MCDRGWNKMAGSRLFRGESLEYGEGRRQKPSRGNHDVADLGHVTSSVDLRHAGRLGSSRLVRCSLHRSCSLQLDAFSSLPWKGAMQGQCSQGTAMTAVACDLRGGYVERRPPPP